MFRNITIGVDGSDHSWHALKVACDLARRYSARLHIVHVPDVPPSAMSIGVGAVDFPVDVEQLMAEGQAVMADAATRARADGVEPASQIVSTGTASAEIIQTAETTGSDLIVTGRRGVGSVMGLLLGSTSQKIAHDAPCACLTVK